MMKWIVMVMGALLVGYSIGSSRGQFFAKNQTGGPVEYQFRCFVDHGFYEHGVLSNEASLPVAMSCPDDLEPVEKGE